MSWQRALAAASGLPDGVVETVVALAASRRAGAWRQGQAALARLRDGTDAEPAAVLAALAATVAPPDGAEVHAAGRRLAAMGARVLLAGHAGYPARLNPLWPELGAPLWLFTLGPPGLPEMGAAVAVVGCRTPSADGHHSAARLAALLAAHDVAVISGLAPGIDQAAHEAALRHHGVTAAVLGTGFGVDYPRGRERLRARIAASAGLFTELAPGAEPRPYQFLERNRIIAGLADAVVVVEGRERSGALATARLGAEQGRDVWAVPGSPNQPTAQAPLALIRDGARPLTRLEDVLESLPLAPGAGTGSTASPGTTPAGMRDGPAVPDGPLNAVASGLSAVPANAAALARLTALPLSTVMSALSELTVLGRARTTPAGWVAADPAADR